MFIEAPLGGVRYGLVWPISLLLDNLEGWKEGRLIAWPNYYKKEGAISQSFHSYIPVDTGYFYRGFNMELVSELR